MNRATAQKWAKQMNETKYRVATKVQKMRDPGGTVEAYSVEASTWSVATEKMFTRVMDNDEQCQAFVEWLRAGKVVPDVPLSLTMVDQIIRLAESEHNRHGSPYTRQRLADLKRIRSHLDFNNGSAIHLEVTA